MGDHGGLIPYMLSVWPLHSHWSAGSWGRSGVCFKRSSTLPAAERKKRNKERKRVQKARRKGR